MPVAARPVRLRRHASPSSPHLGVRPQTLPARSYLPHQTSGVCGTRANKPQGLPSVTPARTDPRARHGIQPSGPSPPVWTSAPPSGPLRDLGPATKHWTIPGLSHPSGHSGLVPNPRRWKDSSSLPRHDPAAATAAGSDRGRSPECPDRPTNAPFFQRFVAGLRSRRGPAEVQQVQSALLATGACSGMDGWSVGPRDYSKGGRPDRPSRDDPPPSLAPGGLFLTRYAPATRAT